MNKNEVLADYGWCQVIKRDNIYIIRYDKGGIAVQMDEIEVTEIEATKALINQIEAEKVVIDIQKRQSFK